jgi:hypothetical protein
MLLPGSILEALISLLDHMHCLLALQVVEGPVPADLVEEVEAKRAELIERVSEVRVGHSRLWFICTGASVMITSYLFATLRTQGVLS